MIALYQELVRLGLNAANIVSVGTGKTVTSILLSAIGDSDFKKKDFVATSWDTANFLSSLGLKVLDASSAIPDFAFDGADYVCPTLGLIVKGLGGALLKEKVLMARAKTRVIVAQASKFVSELENIPIPFEVVREQVSYFNSLRFSFIEKMVVRMCSGGKYGMVVTEKGNNLVDVYFNELNVKNVKTLLAMPGVIETGLFYEWDFLVVKFDESTESVQVFNFQQRKP